MLVGVSRLDVLCRTHEDAAAGAVGRGVGWVANIWNSWFFGSVGSAFRGDHLWVLKDKL